SFSRDWSSDVCSSDLPTSRCPPTCWPGRVRPEGGHRDVGPPHRWRTRSLRPTAGRADPSQTTTLRAARRVPTARFDDPSKDLLKVPVYGPLGKTARANSGELASPRPDDG